MTANTRELLNKKKEENLSLADQLDTLIQKHETGIADFFSGGKPDFPIKYEALFCFSF